MYADRYARPTGLNPGGLGGALILTGAMVAGLIFSAPNVVRTIIEKPFVLDPIDAPKPPPPDPVKPIEKTTPQPRQERIVIPRQLVETKQQPTDFDFTKVLPPPPDFGAIGTGKIVTLPADPPPPPLMPAELDQRYASAFQPNYPPDEVRAGHIGRVVVRVLIGIDGRVQEVQRVSATSDSFFAATARQARNKWRFTPATRGGIPETMWKTIGVSFVLNN